MRLEFNMSENTSSLDVLEGSSVIPNQKEDHAGSWKERFKNTLR